MTNWFSDEQATFGDRLAGAREAAELTQADLARRIGVREKTVRSWEEDLSEPRANRLQMLSGLLNVSLRWLLTGEGHGAMLTSEPVAPIPDDITAVLADIQTLRAEMGKMAEKLGRIEKHLRQVGREAAA